jgi:hypothetical protein
MAEQHHQAVAGIAAAASRRLQTVTPLAGRPAIRINDDHLVPDDGGNLKHLAENLAGAPRARVPEMSPNRHQRPTISISSKLRNLKLAQALNPRSTHGNTLVMRRSLDGDEHQGRKYCHDPIGGGRCTVRDMGGLAASVVLIAILLGVLLVVVFDIFCLLHLGKADTAPFLPKSVWAVLVVCTSPIGGLVYLLTQRLPRRSPEPVTMWTRPPRQPVNRWMGIGWIILVLVIIGLWAGIKSASNPQPQPAVQLTCPAGPMWVLVQGLCPPL